jgi:predicted nucleic acid-binding protein
MPDIVISNTSPIFYLHRLGQLELLHRLYGRILVPEAVVEELKTGGDQGEDVPDIADYDWIEVSSVHVPEVVSLIMDLGPGEAQVLAMALENPCSLAIIDDRLARELAKARDIRITGTVGILLKAKQAGYIKSVKSLLKTLTQLDFRLSEAVVDTILRLAKE